MPTKPAEGSQVIASVPFYDRKVFSLNACSPGVATLARPEEPPEN